MVHGTAQSPVIFQGADTLYFQNGYNVILPRLEVPGGLGEWRQAFDRAVGIAEKLGDEVIVVGFSLGGALAIDRVVRKPAGISEVVLMSPAFGPLSARLEKLMARVLGKHNKWVEKNPGRPVTESKYYWTKGPPDKLTGDHYSQRVDPTMPVTMLPRLQEVRQALSPVVQSQDKLAVRLSIYYAPQDPVIDVSLIEDFARNQNIPLTNIVKVEDTGAVLPLHAEALRILPNMK